MFRHRRLLTGLALFALAVVGVGYCFLIAIRQEPIRSHAQSIRSLADAASLEELRAAVGPMGVFLTTRDGAWVAIRYEDSHAFFSWSRAVALDSAGRWYRSDRHYCGLLHYYQRECQPHEVGSPQAEQAVRRGVTDIPQKLAAVETSGSLEEARRHLDALGLSPLESGPEARSLR